ncbi:MAG: hypothetical protein M3N54_01025, partial [Acidobacteriota bacterium]|nr:hypothetical protein [Acidobacteriota bacterium]
MRSTLCKQLVQFAHLLQTELFGLVEAETGALSDTALPRESTFSRAFAEFALMELPQFVHEAFGAQALEGW